MGFGNFDSESVQVEVQERKRREAELSLGSYCYCRRQLYVNFGKDCFVYVLLVRE